MDKLEEKRRLFLDMQELPEDYSENMLQAMLDAPDMQGDMACFDLLRRTALHDRTDITDEIIAEEWRKFSGKQKKSHFFTFRSSFLKIAAMFIGCMLMLGVAYAAMRMIKERKPVLIAESRRSGEVKAANTVISDTAKQAKVVEPADSIVKFDDAELETVISMMAKHYAVKTEFSCESAKHIHIFFIWNMNTKLADVLEVLNGYDRISVTFADETLIVK